MHRYHRGHAHRRCHRASCPRHAVGEPPAGRAGVGAPARLAPRCRRRASARARALLRHRRNAPGGCGSPGDHAAARAGARRATGDAHRRRAARAADGAVRAGAPRRVPAQRHRAVDADQLSAATRRGRDSASRALAHARRWAPGRARQCAVRLGTALLGQDQAHSRCRAALADRAGRRGDVGRRERAARTADSGFRDHRRLAHRARRGAARPGPGLGRDRRSGAR